jgi:hypothetical protein
MMRTSNQDESNHKSTPADMHTDNQTIQQLITTLKRMAKPATGNLTAPVMSEDNTGNLI